eukprot:Amastigsp_a339449_293.p3 type:complete len:104 gc:universal Amastigsp_a339449_293:423-734(+)
MVHVVRHRVVVRRQSRVADEIRGKVTNRHLQDKRPQPRLIALVVDRVADVVDGHRVARHVNEREDSPHNSVQKCHRALVPSHTHRLAEPSVRAAKELAREPMV